MALASIIANATFSGPLCQDATSSSVSVTNEVSMPLFDAAQLGKSVYEYVTDVLSTSVVEVRSVLLCVILRRPTT